MKNKDYSDIIDKIVEGESYLFEVLMRKFNPYLNKIGRTYGFNHEDTQDLMQETYMNAYKGLSKFEYRFSLKSWITKIMLNNCYHKSIKQDKETDLLRTVSKLEIQSKDTSTIINNELKTVLEKSLKGIPLDYRIVFVLREKNGLNVSETADALEITSSNVKVRLNRAKKMLKKMIAKHYTREDIYEFNLKYCDRMVSNVFKNLNFQNNNQFKIQ